LAILANVHPHYFANCGSILVGDSDQCKCVDSAPCGRNSILAHRLETETCDAHQFNNSFRFKVFVFKSSDVSLAGTGYAVTRRSSFGFLVSVLVLPFLARQIVQLHQDWFGREQTRDGHHDREHRRSCARKGLLRPRG